MGTQIYIHLSGLRQSLRFLRFRTYPLLVIWSLFKIIARFPSDKGAEKIYRYRGPRFIASFRIIGSRYVFSVFERIFFWYLEVVFEIIAWDFLKIIAQSKTYWYKTHMYCQFLNLRQSLHFQRLRLELFPGGYPSFEFSAFGRNDILEISHINCRRGFEGGQSPGDTFSFSSGFSAFYDLCFSRLGRIYPIHEMGHANNPFGKAENTTAPPRRYT